MPVEYFVLFFGGGIVIVIGVWKLSILGTGVGKSEKEALEKMKQEFPEDVEYKKLGENRKERNIMNNPKFSSIFLALVLLACLVVAVLYILMGGH